MKIYNLLLLLLINSAIFGQINAGKIIFERRTNLEKKFTEGRIKQMIGDANKIRTELFYLYFNDTASIFKPILSDQVDPLNYTTNKNTIFQNFKSNQKLSVLSILGQSIYVKDTNYHREWKITESTREIAGYECIKAVWEKDDTTRLYAWFTEKIIPSVGPEGFDGLPGAILGLATEDGGVIYFAKSVEKSPVNEEVFIIDLRKKEIYSMAELKLKIEKDFGNSPRGKRFFSDIFRWL